MPFLRSEKTVFAILVVLLCILAPQLKGQREKDPHRPACTSAPCQRSSLFCGLIFAALHRSGMAHRTAVIRDLQNNW
jgi:hypothetical protein